jgi:hypothetical protein
MDNNRIETNEDSIDLRDKLTILILDCFDQVKIETSIFRKIMLSNYVSVISQKESLELMNFLTSFLEEQCCSKELWKKNFEYFIQSIMKARELCNEIRNFY